MGRQRRRGGCCLYDSISIRLLGLVLRRGCESEEGRAKGQRRKVKQGKYLRSTRSSRCGRFSRPFFKLSVTFWRSSSWAAAWSALDHHQPTILHISIILLVTPKWEWARTAQHCYLARCASRATPLDPVGAADVSLTNSGGREKARGRGWWGSRRWRRCGVLLSYLQVNPFYLLFVLRFRYWNECWVIDCVLCSEDGMNGGRQKEKVRWDRGQVVWIPWAGQLGRCNLGSWSLWWCSLRQRVGLA